MHRAERKTSPGTVVDQARTLRAFDAITAPRAELLTRMANGESLEVAAEATHLAEGTAKSFFLRLRRELGLGKRDDLRVWWQINATAWLTHQAEAIAEIRSLLSFEIRTRLTNDKPGLGCVLSVIHLSGLVSGV